MIAPGVSGQEASSDVLVPLELLEALVDPDDCWFDHHGGCQAHGYLSLQAGEVCPQAQLKQVIAATDNTGTAR